MLNEFLILMRQELVLVAILVILLLMKLGKERSNESLMTWVNLLLLVNVCSAFFGMEYGSLFNGMFHTTPLIAFEKTVLSLATLIISMQSWSWLKNHPHAAEFYMLLVATLLGMFLMISAGNLLMFYLGLEMSTIPLAAMANFNLAQRRSSEAAMKLIISSAFSSGLLLFGISLVYGTTGTLDFQMISNTITAQPLVIFAFVLVVAGFAFKISVVPFHLWTADVYEGAPVAVTSYLSVVSKGAVIFVFVSVLYRVFQPLAGTWYNMLFILSLLTIIIGNLFAIRQDNFKRFLAFSSIAQVGFILVGISGSSNEGAASVVFFVLIYVFSNLAAFGVISVVSALANKESISDYKGFYKTNPALSWVLTIAMFSLAGVPPTAGFFGKFFLMLAGAAKGNYLLISIAALNMVISFYYYLRIVKAIFMDSNDQPIIRINTPLLSKMALAVCVAGILIAGVYGGLYDHVHALVSNFQSVVAQK